jgi:hypothetical protein
LTFIRLDWALATTQVVTGAQLLRTDMPQLHTASLLLNVIV